MVRALIAADSEERLAFLAHAATRLFGPAAELCAFRVSRASVDPELAWGTKQPAVQRLDERRRPAEWAPAEPTPAEDSTQVPLLEVGDSAVAIIDAARRVGADVIVAAADDSGWLARLSNGSATTDLIRTPSMPVLVVDERYDHQR